jgi:hypothetical protein
MKTANHPVKSSFRKVIPLIMMASLLQQPVLSWKARKEGPHDAIIVPGFPYREGKGAGLILKIRIKWAHQLVSKGIARNVIFSGSAVYTPYVESRIMAMYAMEPGVPADRIFCETKAKHSTENVIYSYRMARAMGFEKIAIATGPYQSAFLSTYVEDHAAPVSFIPIPLQPQGKTRPGRFPGIDASEAFVDGFVSLVDRETHSERQQGTLGNKIESVHALSGIY